MRDSTVRSVEMRFGMAEYGGVWWGTGRYGEVR